MNTVTCLPIGKTGRQATTTCVIEDRQPHTCMHPPITHGSPVITDCVHTYVHPRDSTARQYNSHEATRGIVAAISEQEGKGQRAFVLMVWNTAFFHPLLSL